MTSKPFHLKLSPLAAAILVATGSSAHAASIEVNSVEDVGTAAITLAEALALAAADEDDDLITFSNELSNTSLELENQEREALNGKLIIDGEDAPGLTLNVVNTGNAFSIENSSLEIRNLSMTLDTFELALVPTAFISASNSEVLLDNVTLNGRVGSLLVRERQGILAEDSDVTLLSSSITGMFMDGDSGSAIHFTNTGDYQNALYVYDSSISNNGVPLADSSGSTVFVEAPYSDVEIIESTFSGNYTQAGTSGIEFTGSLEALNISIFNSVFSNNTASDEADGVGALKISTNLNEEDGSLELAIQNSSFSGNSGGLASNIDLYTDHLYEANISILNSTISNGESDSGNFHFNNNGNSYTGLEIVHSTISNNRINESETLAYAHAGVSIESNIDYEAGESFNLDIFNSIISGNEQVIYDEAESVYLITDGDLSLKGVLDSQISHSLIFSIDQDENNLSYGTLNKTALLENTDPVFASVDLSALEEFDAFEEFEELDIPSLCLSEQSPAIDSARKSITNNFSLQEDLFENNRLEDEAPDMGAIEYQSCNPDPVGYNGPLFKKTKGSFGFIFSGFILLSALFRLRLTQR